MVLAGQLVPVTGAFVLVNLRRKEQLSLKLAIIGLRSQVTAGKQEQETRGKTFVHGGGAGTCLVMLETLCKPCKASTGSIIPPSLLQSKCEGE